MPELPEVETVRRQLAPIWLGAKILRVETGPASYFFVTPPRTLKKRLIGCRLEVLERHGKYLVARFRGGGALLLHLGMTGQLAARTLPRDPHLHLILHLSEGRCISFRDVRKFGKVEWIPPNGTSARLSKLGPDALDATSEQVRLALSKRSIAIKAALLDQKVWAGVGNIYADEGLFAAGIRPTRAAKSLTKAQTDQLVSSIQNILKRAIRHGGSTINDYVQPEGKLGGFQNWHQVYGKTKDPCPGCGKPIIRKVIAGRSSHYCNRCQI